MGLNDVLRGLTDDVSLLAAPGDALLESSARGGRRMQQQQQQNSVEKGGLLTELNNHDRKLS